MHNICLLSKLARSGQTYQVLLIASLCTRSDHQLSCYNLRTLIKHGRKHRQHPWLLDKCPRKLLVANLVAKIKCLDMELRCLCAVWARDRSSGQCSTVLSAEMQCLLSHCSLVSLRETSKTQYAVAHSPPCYLHCSVGQKLTAI